MPTMTRLRPPPALLWLFVLVWLVLCVAMLFAPFPVSPVVMVVATLLAMISVLTL